jgi:hypothetical protein
VVDRPEALSFRDPDNFAWQVDGRWFRVASRESAEALRTLRKSATYATWVERGEILAFDEADVTTADRVLSDLDGRSRTAPDGAAVFSIDTIDTLSYPWEWPNESLATAARLTLGLRDGLLDLGLDLKDASAFNVQFRGNAPVFMDIGSIERWRPNPSWNASRQFIEHFINPLAIGSSASVSSADAWSLSRGRGVGSDAARSLMPAHLRRRMGLLLLHATTKPVKKNAPSEVRYKSDADENRDLALKATRSLTKRLRSNVDKLVSGVHQTTWADYGSRDHYSSDDLQRKRDMSVAFVGSTAAPGDLVLDIGGNDGYIAAELTAKCDVRVAVIDADAGALDHIASQGTASGSSPSVMALRGDLTNFTEDSGLLGAEFSSFYDRFVPSAVLCQAVLHHIVITQGVPMGLAVAALARFQAPLQIEFVLPADEKARQLISQIPDWHGDYSLESLLSALTVHYSDVAEIGRTSTTRVVVEARGLRVGTDV